MSINFNNVKKVKHEIADIEYSKYITFDEPLKEEISIEEEVLLRASPSSFTAYEDLLVEGSRLCSLCDKIFPNSFTFLQHNIIHIEVPLMKIETYSCRKCDEIFQSKTELDKHAYAHKSATQNELQKCDICNKTYTRKYWNAHVDEVHGMLRLECQLCNKVVKTLKTLKYHMMFVHDKKYKPWRFRRPPNEGDGEYQCEKCPKIFKHKYSLQTHVKNCHANLELECEICKKMFTSKPYLNTHLQRVHYVDGQEHLCDICGKSFKSKRRVSIHKKNSHRYKL